MLTLHLYCILVKINKLLIYCKRKLSTFLPPKNKKERFSVKTKTIIIVIINAEATRLNCYTTKLSYRSTVYVGWSVSELKDGGASATVQWSSGLDGDRRLAVDLPESGTVQSSDHPGAAGPLRGDKLGPDQRGASCDHTETSRVGVRGLIFRCDFKDSQIHQKYWIKKQWHFIIRVQNTGLNVTGICYIATFLE